MRGILLLAVLVAGCGGSPLAHNAMELDSLPPRLRAVMAAGYVIPDVPPLCARFGERARNEGDGILGANAAVNRDFDAVMQSGVVPPPGAREAASR
ncbi:MAG TPA: hypothetical protein EYQ24_00590 [Bacteroidetes bacterium]|nr:hypothetical protein [Bacteroidota bacterium]HIL56959.1 hypothetical protein [Rhodothermales bacterium]